MNPNNFYGLNGLNVLVTGSSRGIGEAIARVFKEYSANVILHGRSRSNRLVKLSREINSKYIFCDAGDEEAVKKAVGSLESHIDILVNNAGISMSKEFEDISTQDWYDVFGSNVMSAINFSKAVIPNMSKLSPMKRIINIGSIRGHASNAGSSAYSASKAAIINLTASMANQYAPDNILVNCVAPGFTETDMTFETWSDRIQKQVSEIPLRRMAKPREIAETVVFLASDKASYITGQTITVDGGLVIKS